MATEAQEIIADIIAEMRIFKCRDLETGKLEPCNAIANYFADRLDRAWMKTEIEIANLRKENAKFREALEKQRQEIGRFYSNEWIPYDAWIECYDMISHALATPPTS